MASLTLLNLDTPPPSAKRAYPKAALSTRSFTAAKFTKQTMDWAMDPLSRDQKVYQSIRALRFRSRHLADNDHTMARFLALCVTNIIGPHGIKMQPKVKLLRGDKLDEKLNAQIATEWQQWCRKGNCSVDGQYSFHAIERLLARTAPMDGEALFLKNAWDNRWGFALQMLDIDQLDTTYFVQWNGRNEIRMGVEVDKFRRPQAYWLFSGNPTELGQSPQTRYRIDAAGVIHLFAPDAARQTRGIPWATPAMTSMNMLHGYREAELVAARVGASVMGFIKRPAPEDDGSLKNLTGEEQEAERTDAEEIDVAPGGFHSLFDGEDVTTFKSEHPSMAYSAFVKECKRDIATALQVSFTSLADDLSEVNFSSIRAGLLLERDMWRVRQKWMIEQFHEPVFRAWLSAAVLSGVIDLSMRDMDTVCAQIKWHPRGWDWVDPLKDAQASALGVQNLTTTLTREVSARGLDIDELIAERKAEVDKIRAAGIEVGTDNKGDATTASDDQGAKGVEGDGSAKPKAEGGAAKPKAARLLLGEDPEDD